MSLIMKNKLVLSVCEYGWLLITLHKAKIKEKNHHQLTSLTLMARIYWHNYFSLDWANMGGELTCGTHSSSTESKVWRSRWNCEFHWGPRPQGLPMCMALKLQWRETGMGREGRPLISLAPPAFPHHPDSQFLAEVARKRKRQDCKYNG